MFLGWIPKMFYNNDRKYIQETRTNKHIGPDTPYVYLIRQRCNDITMYSYFHLQRISE